VVTGHESAKDWQAYFFYVKSDAALETRVPRLRATAAKENEYLDGERSSTHRPHLFGA
jgi:hypothetical protein